LPCAHIFHEKCIIDWLTQHCTCPVCRYELETDDAQYEKFRKARMRSRKPRIHRYVLEHMSIQELQKLAKELKILWPRRIREKRDILEVFSKSGKIEIIAAPKPVEYGIEELRSMGVSKLRNAMAEAGVFFNPRDVLEKEDMVRIFCNSGRLILLSESDSNCRDRKPAATVPYKAPEPPMEPSMNLESLQEGFTFAHSSGYGDEKKIDNGNAKKHVLISPLVETVEENEDVDRGDILGSTTNMFEGFGNKIYASAGVVDEGNHCGNLQNWSNQEDLQNSESDQRMGTDDTLLQGVIDVSVPKTETLEKSNECFAREDTRPAFAEINFLEQYQVTSSDQEMTTKNDEKIAADHKMYETYKISDLRAAAFSLNIDLSSCIERSEMVEKLVQARNGIVFRPEDFNCWSVSDLRAIATAAGVDLSICGDRTAMIQHLIEESRLRPHVANYLGSLMPLAKLSVSEIRALAREWRVNISDCIEKEEMIHRLVASTIPI